jgi:hypothetical protein
MRVTVLERVARVVDAFRDKELAIKIALVIAARLR